MPTLHATNTWNIQTTINQWLIDKAATITLPFSLNYTFEFEWTQLPISTPCISVFHADINRERGWLGDNAGGEQGVEAANLADISIWVSRANNPNWIKHMAVLRSVVEAVFASPHMIAVKDYRASTSAPSNTAYGVRIVSLQMGATMQDTANANIMRSINRLRYEWALRTSVT